MTLLLTSQEKLKQQTVLPQEQTVASATTDRKEVGLSSVNEIGFIERGTGQHQSNTVYGTDGICPCEYSVQYKEPFKILE